MRYRLTCLTPLLVGDGRKLSPIDYMVWKDQVNVLDQWRIFRLLAKGPRLDGYLSQLKRADKLDFASWGGFAQNFAGRRIPFESAAYSAYWNRASGDSLHIPTFSTGASGPYLPGAAIKGALRTGMVFANWKSSMLNDVAARAQGDRLPRRLSENTEEQAVGNAGASRMRLIGVGDSAPVSNAGFKVYLLRVSTLQPRGAGYALGWKQSPRGAVDGARPDESTPVFAEMAAPGVAFEGGWQDKAFYTQPEIRRAVRWQESFDRGRIFEAANDYSARLLALHKQYAGWTGLDLLGRQVEELERQLAGAREAGQCLISIGWGGGLLSKSAWLDTGDATYRQILQKVPLYNRALSSNLPFPKTRRIVFLNNKPASLPGWALLEVKM
ncbi:MAG TPA: type III-A CRISPR-associated RAMP protein Csm5 [Bryobacteraceae bacterium]|nr:type III-A CRISPR-associated RAMP protein Csm5 [Bryobacteraceae bacterium]